MENKRRVFYDQVVTEIARQNGFKDTRLEFTAGCKPGENFLGELLRCIVSDKSDPTKKLHLMVKLPPENEMQRARFRVDECFQVEAAMYRQVLPTLADFLKEKGMLRTGEPFPSSARTYGIRIEEENMIIVMEDLKHRGFSMCDPKTGLDEAHCRLVLQQLALLHASSLALQRAKPALHQQLAAQLKEVMFPGRVPPTFTKAMECSRSFIEERFPIGTLEREKFEQYLENNSEILLNAVKTNSTLCCITHGDLWVNNILFSYKEGSTEPENVKFIDLQVSRMASPILDLSYFFCLCTRKDTRRSFHALIKVYYDSLTKNLSALGHDPDSIVPWNIFQDELQKYFNFGWGSVVKILPFALLDEQTLTEFQKMFFAGNLTENPIVLPKNTDYLKTVLSDLLEDLVRLGFM